MRSIIARFLIVPAIAIALVTTGTAMASAQAEPIDGDVHAETLSATLVGWGSNIGGELGLGTQDENPHAPAAANQAQLGTAITDIAGGGSNSVAVRADGTVWEWGITGAVTTLSPVQVMAVVNPPTPLTQAVAVSRKGWSTLVLRTDGSIWSWGYDHYGQLGRGSFQSTSVRQVTGAQDYVAIASGGAHSLAVKADGTVWAWGADFAGQLGRGAPGDASHTPVQVPGLTNVVAVAAGSGFSFALKQDGTVWAWGANALGQTGVGCCADVYTPTQIPGLSGITAVAAGWEHALALDSSGLVHAWGDNTYGQVGDPAGATDAVSPITVDGVSDVDDISAGGQFSMARKTDGTVWSWGRNGLGQLGTGNADPADGPIQAFGVIGAREIDAGSTHALVLRRDDFGARGEFTAVTPSRILDTRDGTGRNGVVGPLGSGATFDVQVTGEGGVPATGIGAVILNATVANPTQFSYLTVWPSGVSPKPTVSNLNYVPGQIVANLVTVAVGSDGKLSVFNNLGTVNVIFDVVGYYAATTGDPGSRFHGVTPFRYFDTRDGTGAVPATPLAASGTLNFNVLGKGGVPASGSGVTAVVMNVTVTAPTGFSFLTVYPADVSPRPLASNLNYVPGLTVPNLVTVRVPANGQISFYNNSGTAHVIADVVGYYDGDKSTDAGRFFAVTPARLFDSRSSSPFAAPGKLPPGGVLTAQSAFTAQRQAVQNVTVTEPTGAGYITVFPDPPPPPLASNVNYVGGQTVANLVIGTYGSHRRLDYFNSFGGSTHLIIDVFGFFSSTDA